MDKKESLIEFPCYFPIKIMGYNDVSFKVQIIEIVRKHFPNTDEQQHITVRESAQGNYLSITATVYTHNQASLDALYMELTQHPFVKWVL